ncbi:Spermine/spermidine acetyltransferase [compost metagenome]
MLQSLIEHLVQLYDCNKIYLSLYEDNLAALTLYEKFGFQFNGELDINGEKVMVKEL